MATSVLCQDIVATSLVLAAGNTGTYLEEISHRLEVYKELYRCHLGISKNKIFVVWDTNDLHRRNRS